MPIILGCSLVLQAIAFKFCSLFSNVLKFATGYLDRMNGIINNNNIIIIIGNRIEVWTLSGLQTIHSFM